MFLTSSMTVWVAVAVKPNMQTFGKSLFIIPFYNEKFNSINDWSCKVTRLANTLKHKTYQEIYNQV